MNTILIHFILLTILLFTPCLATAGHADNYPPLEKVTLQLTWKHQFQFAGFYAAVEQGFFAEQGLEVEILEFQKGSDPVEEVARGRADFGIYSDELLFKRMAGKPIVLLANYFKRYPMVLLARPGLKTVGDLKGKRLMISSKSAKSMIVSAAFNQAGLVPGENIDLYPSSFDVGSLVRDEVDAITGFRSNESFLLDQRGFSYETIELTDALPGLGDINLFTSEEQVLKHPEQTRAFVEASNRGWRYALDHLEETVDLILKSYNPDANRNALLFEAKKNTRDGCPGGLPCWCHYGRTSSSNGSRRSLRFLYTSSKFNTS